MFTSFFGVQPPDWVSYGFFPIVICLSLHYYAYGYLLMSGALATVDSELEEAGAICGMNRRQRLWRITLPLLMPALGSAIVLTFIRILGTFGTPALLGLPLIVMAITFIWVNNRIIGIRKSFVTLTGKGFRQNEIGLGVWRWPATIAVALFVTISVVLPMLILLWESLIITPGVYSLEGLTSHFWLGEGDPDIAYGEPGIVHSPGILNALWNSCKLGVTAAVLNGLMGLLIGYAAVRGRGTLLSKWLETFAILVLITVVKNLPFTSRTGIAAMMQIDKSLEETARVQGIGWFRRMIQIIIPMSTSGLISGMLLTFITAMRELSLIILLLSPTNMVLTGLIFNYNEQDMTQHSGAVTLLLVIIIIGVNLLVRILSGGKGLSGLKSG
jgi:iron(III) transport system permease protein